jgi:hypothetical protein
MTETAVATARKAMFGSLDMSVAQVLAGLDAGVMMHRTFPTYGFVFVPRWCADCGASLPCQTIDGAADTFPRCSAHAF